MAKVLITKSYLTFLLIALTALTVIFPSAYAKPTSTTSTTTTHKTSTTTQKTSSTVRSSSSIRSSSSSAAKSSSSSQPSPSSTLAVNLFPPAYTYTSGFTTSNITNPPAGVSKLALSDANLNAVRVSNTPPHPIVSKAGKTAYQATYPQGSFSPSNDPEGGITMYIGGSTPFYNAIQLGAKEVMMGYSVLFDQGFQWVLGGKIPGIFGGQGSSAFACTGGRQDGRDLCFDVRLMWRSSGLGELYAYLPLTAANNATLVSVPPFSYVNPDYGISVGRGAWTFPTNSWTTIAERVKLNDPGKTNGEMQLYINGTSVINVTNLQFRNSTQATIQGMHFQTFFGGSTSDWASPTNQSAWFADVSGAVISS